MLAPSLVDTLRHGRDLFNTRFALARRRWPGLDSADFALFLRDQLSPLIAAVARVAPDLAPTVADHGYDLGLQLVGQRLAGPTAADSTLNRLYVDVLPLLAAQIAAAPATLPAALVNAAHQLATTPDARPVEWLRWLAALGPLCPAESADAPRALAALLAWRAGLAHLRTAALSAASPLPPALACAAVGADSADDWAKVSEEILQNPWPRDAAPAAQLRRVGAFRGYGGLFPCPPTVAATGDDTHFLVHSGDECWLLVADRHGATFHRASAAERAAVQPVEPTAAALRRLGALARELPAAPTSVACTAHSCAVTSADSHHIWVAPLPAAAR
jgi:hypothetical protein